MKCMSAMTVAELRAGETAAASRCCRAGCRQTRSFAAAAAQRPEVELEHVGLVHDELATCSAQRALQLRHQVAVDFDRRRAGRSARAAGAVSAPRPGPISTMPVARTRVDGARRCARARPGRAGNAGRSACARRIMRAGVADASCEPDRTAATGCRDRPGRCRRVERRAVIDRGAHDRQAERDVDGVAEARVLEHRQALVVVHRERPRRCRPSCAGVNAVSAGTGPRTAMPSAARASRGPARSPRSPRGRGGRPRRRADSGRRPGCAAPAIPKPRAQVRDRARASVALEPRRRDRPRRPPRAAGAWSRARRAASPADQQHHRACARRCARPGTRCGR